MRARHLAAAGLAALAMIAPAASAGPLPPLPGIPVIMPFPELGSYHGGLFPSDVLLGLGLACNLADGALACFDTPIQAKAAGPAQPRAGDNCYPALRVWQEPGREGGMLALYHKGYWQDLDPSWRNSISSWATGCDRTVRFSDLPRGRGAKLERKPRRAGDMPPGWNDRVDAIYRA
ncbi:MAG: hypothetical protein QOD86_215 [Miltoncostaeaceae bacterium]|jgi:hypothetical protein|nr:hypothetical protein [Miltoncostaeaceae bacterium]